MAYRVAQSNPSASTLTTLYTCPQGSEAVISSLTVAEHGGVPTTYRILLRPGGAEVQPRHRLVFDAPVGPNDTVFMTAGVVLSEGDVLSVEAGTSAVTFMAFISETDLEV